jgi:uncharacterized caspase-like protein
VNRRYRALLVGNWHYPEDSANLPDLKGPLNDVSRLAGVLADPEVGMFTPGDVVTLTERASYEITAELEQFFAEATRQDVLLVYYSGHGITSDDGHLLLCGRNTRTDRKLATTVSSETVNRMIQQCPAAAVVIMLDCCHAGAFKAGEFASELSGKGRFVLAASRSRDRAPDAEHATGMSRFTGHVLRALRGEAALPGSGHITLSDVYRYVHRQMTTEGQVIPQRRFDGDGEVAIARCLSTVEVQVPTLAVSETLIELGTVEPGETLPVERIHVTASGRWTATTEADWVALTVQPSTVEISLSPRAGAERANVVVRNEETGETRTIRIVARVRAPQPDPAPQVAGTWVAAATATAVEATQRRPSQLIRPELPVGWVLNASGMQGLESGPQTAVSKVGKAARKAARVADSEANLALLSLPTGGVVFFTTRAMYWTDQGDHVAVAYREFPVRDFVARTSTHVDFGDGHPRLVGSRARELVALLESISARLTPSEE